LGTERRAYKDYDMTTYMPDGSYDTYWSRYDISNGVLTEVNINEIPLKIAAKAEVQGRTIAAIE